MDKYTVDLDQVLNDFEYSELTDQHSKNVYERPQTNVPFQPPPVAKHSINTVFHSLNEYLNSDINSGSGCSSLSEARFPEVPEKLGITDNKLHYNPEQASTDAKELHSNISKHTIDNLDNTFKATSQNEQLQPLHQNAKGTETKTNSLNPLENTDESNNHASTLVETAILSNKDIFQNNPEEVSSIVVEHTEEISSNVNNKKQENLETLPERLEVISDAFEKNSVNSFKTETSDFSLLETKKVELKSLPELNCTESFIEKEASYVNNDLECDKTIIDKADSMLGKDEFSFEGKECYFEVNNGMENVTCEADINNSVNISKEKDELSKDTDNMLVNIDEDSFQSVNTQNQLEDFIIEPSKSPYALGLHALHDKPDVCSEFSETPNISIQEEEENTFNNEIHLPDKELEQSNKKELSETCELPSVNKNIDENIEQSNIESLEVKRATNLQESSDNLSINTKMYSEDHLEENIAPQTIVGFSNDIDIDENELNKMLEDLEIEEDLKLEENVPAREIPEENIEDLRSNVVSFDEKVKESAQVAVETKEDLKTEFQVISSDQQVTVVNLNTPDSSNVKLVPQIIECQEMERPKKSKKSSKSGEPNRQESKTTVKETLNNKPELIDTDVKSEELSLRRDEHQESLSRPQDLPLNNELKDENVGRKINLIGSPGSTPYNNVYINKSIEPKTSQEIESDYTSSASPTFSDCSTESTSTASTVSVEDVPKFSKKKSGIKNTNIKSESRESTQVHDAAKSNVEGDSGVQDNINSGHLNSQNVVETVNSPNEGNKTEATLNNSEIGAGDPQVQSSQSADTFLDKAWLGKEAPLWIPDADAPACLHCDLKFTVLKRRHHCRACGLVLCSKCCNLKFRLEYLETEARVCTKCHDILNKDASNNAGSDPYSPESDNSPAFRPNPNNPLEYCSTVSPLQQAGQAGVPPPSVMVPVGVLKRKGSNKKSNKSVMFCDGIAPGSDLTHLDQDFNYNLKSKTRKSLNKEAEVVNKKEDSEPPPSPPAVVPNTKVSRNQPKIDQDTGCFIPKNETSLPPTVSINKTDILYSDCSNTPSVVEILKNESLLFAINQNLFVHVQVINMSCCINKQAWCFCTEGLINVGSDEVVYLIEYFDEESFVPKDVFFHVQNVYIDAVKGTSIKELGLSLHNTFNFLDSRNHAGFVYIKPTFQCLENLIAPKEPYLIGILIHRWETPWAKLFPLRLILRLGAEYRYYPSPLISTRHRESMFVEIGHTIINLLADFRNFTYTLPQIRGLIIHMEDKKTTITIPKNRYDQVMKSINNSSEHILAFAGNFSPNADSHLVCIQDTQGHENSYTTHAINIHNKPRKLTGASFIVFNGSLKSSSGLTAKSNIVEDGLMIQVPSENLDKIRENLRNMKTHTIACGCINAASDETVNIVWGENDVDFNVGVNSPVDLSVMKGIPSIRVHNGKDHFCNNGTRLIRWTEVFIWQSGEENPKNQDPVDISKVSESIAKACCTALVKYLDLLVSNSCQKIGIRTTLHVENVSYSAGSNGLKLPPIYMRSLDNELVPVLHRITSNNLGDNAVVLELIFRILNA